VAVTDIYLQVNFDNQRNSNTRAVQSYQPANVFGNERSARLLYKLRHELALPEKRNGTILVTAYGRSFSVKSFGHMMSAAIRKAHGLRKAAARRLTEAGCSANEIMAMTGHKTMAEVERYTRAAEQERLARQAIQNNLRVANVS